MVWSSFGFKTQSFEIESMMITNYGTTRELTTV